MIRSFVPLCKPLSSGGSVTSTPLKDADTVLLSLLHAGSQTAPRYDKARARPTAQAASCSAPECSAREAGDQISPQLSETYQGLTIS